MTYQIVYDRAWGKGKRKTYRRTFESIDRAVAYAGRKASEPNVKRVRGFEYDEQDGLTYVFEMAL